VNNDGNISTSINFKQGRGVKVEKTKDGYRLLQLRRKTMTGKIVETFEYE